MQYIGHVKPKLLVADEGYHIRDINDVYTPAKYDDNRNIIEEEHYPYYSTVIFLADTISSLEQCEELYIEERIEVE